MYFSSDMDNKVDPTTYLVEILDFYKYKLLNNGCAMDEILAVTKAIVENGEIDGTISDFAKFYDVSETNVRATISRKLIAKPKRKLLYPFHKFAKVIPERWRKK